MKYPEIKTFADCRLADFDAIIDVRSPSEFALDHIPGAMNCPVLDDEQRVQIGTLYKQVDPFTAKKLGAALVAINIGHHLTALFQDKPRHWRPLVYCWRGGNRSGSMAHIFAKIGWPVAQLEGGYKAYRQQVVQDLSEQAPSIDWRVICGPTGSGKSRLLKAIAAQGGQVLDLEELANHRGSVLGDLPNLPQPSQKLFESRIWQTFGTLDPARPVFVEAESKKVGQVAVPEAIIQAMRQARCINLEPSIADRVKLLLEDYEHFVASPQLLSQQLRFLTSLHGNAIIDRWCEQAEQGDLSLLVTELLEKHYDPAYRRSISRNFVQNSDAPVFAEMELTTLASNILALR